MSFNRSERIEKGHHSDRLNDRSPSPVATQRIDGRLVSPRDSSTVTDNRDDQAGHANSSVASVELCEEDPRLPQHEALGEVVQRVAVLRKIFNAVRHQPHSLVSDHEIIIRPASECPIGAKYPPTSIESHAQRPDRAIP